MARSIIIVAVLLVGLSYACLFLHWNTDTTANIVILSIGFLGDPFWVAGVPVGFLPILGALIGAIVMAIAAWMPWASQRKAAKAAMATLEKAKVRLREQKELIAERDEQIAQLQPPLDDLGDQEELAEEIILTEEDAPPEVDAQDATQGDSSIT